ncbi:MAG: hypothetical protein M1833_002199 [Piccolia ochrophora]|nr:MAG: hypothetical protein M1833_002199 [Piccolia ochrophora]
MHSIRILLASFIGVEAGIIPRQDPGMQYIPTTPKAPGTFFNEKGVRLKGMPPISTETPPEIYGTRDIDIPFGRLYHGQLNFYPTSNNPPSRQEKWGGQYDNANQSACGIPDNGFWISKVGIHPYFLKYAGLDRYCMQDVCISFWTENGKSDMMLKVTDICTSDSGDGVPCMTPQDIKIERTKSKIIYGLNYVPQIDTYPEKVWWFFMKCWGDGLAPPTYQTYNNWFTEPHLPNNLKFAQTTITQQIRNNNKNYPARGWPTYPNGAYKTNRVEAPVTDWVPGSEPCFTPLAGGESTAKRGGTCPQVS